MSPNTTFAPSWVNILASTAPCPRAPPLISATLPASRVISFSLGKSLQQGITQAHYYCTGGASASVPHTPERSPRLAGIIHEPPPGGGGGGAIGMGTSRVTLSTFA